MTAPTPRKSPTATEQQHRAAPASDAFADYVKADRDFMEARMPTFSASMQAKAKAVIQTADALLAALKGSGPRDERKEGEE